MPEHVYVLWWVLSCFACHCNVRNYTNVGLPPLHQITRALVTRAKYFATMFYFSWVFQIRSVEKLKVGVDLLNVDVSDIKQKWRRIFLK